jgi:hypothetical protein
MPVGTPDPSTLGPLSRRVLEYSDVMERTVEAAKQSGFTDAGWAELEALIDPVRFERVGNDKAVMGWPVYRDLLNKWAGTTEFWSQFRRISEVGNAVFLELTEHNTPKGGQESVVHSMSVYDYDDSGKLVRLQIYLQHD